MDEITGPQPAGGKVADVFTWRWPGGAEGIVAIAGNYQPEEPHQQRQPQPKCPIHSLWCCLWSGEMILPVKCVCRCLSLSIVVNVPDVNQSNVRAGIASDIIISLAHCLFVTSMCLICMLSVQANKNKTFFRLVTCVCKDGGGAEVKRQRDRKCS